MTPPLTLCVLAALLALGQTGPDQARRAEQAVASFDVVDVDGRRWRADDLRGRVTLIEFWGTWCAPCLAELPRLAALRARFSRHEFEILGVMLDAKSRRDIRAWLNRHRLDWPQIHQPRRYEDDVPSAFGVERLPASVLLDSAGSVAGLDLRGAALEQRVEGLIDAGRLRGEARTR